MNANKDKKNHLEQEVQKDVVAAETEHADSAVLSDKEMAGVVGGYSPPRHHPGRVLNLKRNHI